MSEEDKYFIKRYEELLDKGYCDCNEMNCIDNNSPRRILNIVKDLENQLQQKENIIKEVRELLKRYQKNEYYYKYDGKYLKSEIKEDILEILDKENK